MQATLESELRSQADREEYAAWSEDEATWNTARELSTTPENSEANAW